ncbi:MAG TPA: heparan-alpha-glucosaminide N-acetyltransferase domain-containing protein [Gemmatimonadaceae bacterium]
MTPATTRRTYLDWMRGLAVLIMIEAHIVDSWTRLADRQSDAFGWSLILGGFGAPLFLFLAGVAVALSAGSKSRRLGSDAAAARLVERRGLEIFLLAFVFRVQAWVISRSAARAMLRVDILNIMGPSIVATAVLWRLARSMTSRAIIFALATCAFAFATPLVRATALLDPLPDHLEGYLRPIPGITNFSAFPWAAFVPAGAFLGLFIDRARTRPAETRVNWWFAIGGAAVAVIAYALSWRPSIYARSNFWTSSPTFFFLRLGLMTTTIAAVYLWESRPAAGRRWSPMALLGRSSLFIYWIHVEMVSGLISLPLHKALGLWQSWLALGIFTVFMLGCAMAKERVMRWGRTRRGSAVPGPAPAR